MEASVKPRLDWYHGHMVKKVKDTDEGATIEFESGVQVISTNGNYSIPQDVRHKLPGTKLLTTILTADETTLKFGHTKQVGPDLYEADYVADVTLDPLNYAISDPSRGRSDNPQQPEELDDSWMEGLSLRHKDAAEPQEDAEGDEGNELPDRELQPSEGLTGPDTEE